MTTKPIKEKPKPELPASKISKEKSAQKAEKAEKTPPKGPPKGPQIKTLGPVSDLGKYVTRDWWKRIFDAYYLKTDGDVVNDANITSTEVNLFSNVLELKPEFRVLDLCCGQGRHTLELARRGYKSLYGLDQSHYLIQRAKSQARKENLHVNFQKGDARKIPYPVDYFDTVMIPGNSFGYFETLNDDLKVLKDVFRVLKPGGKLLLDITDGTYIKEKYQPRSWEWIDKQYFVVRERSISPDGRLLSREIITDVSKGVIDDRFYGERLYSKDAITKLLRDAGYTEVTFHASITPDSQRNQDLGMMERRFIITASVQKEWTPVKARKPDEVKAIAVIFGDPNINDPVKPGSKFDDDDFKTIDALKKALYSTKQYKITYINSHASIIQDLTKIKDKVDLILNLCDEGFTNDPRKELHIPSLLDVIGIPYTGAGPQCLAFCYDKSLVRGVAKEMGIAVADAFFIRPEDQVYDLQIGFPVIVKPNFGDSSFGINQRSVCNNIEELAAAIMFLRVNMGYDKPILVEEFLTGKDLTIGIIGNPGHCVHILPIVEEDYSLLPPELPRICGYEAKWDSNSPYWKLRSVPAELAEETQKMIETSSLKLFERLECRDYARFDWRLNAAGKPKLLEVNPNPGWCWDGHLAKMCRFVDVDYPKMLTMIIDSAFERLGMKNHNPPPCDAAAGLNHS